MDSSVQYYFNFLIKIETDGRDKLELLHYYISLNIYEYFAVRDAFIRVMASTRVCQLLLENQTLDLQITFDQF